MSDLLPKGCETTSTGVLFVCVLFVFLQLINANRNWNGDGACGVNG